ncbi:hypothetical protein [Oceanicoccus sp. KOV_DT_Chl]|uniref:hypothetical protein n=1 Tax=Oceanicoccus sp. KOV_DT_Chl TaxID=1904639 RepID=UPI000C7CFEE8|nr:hypothetical protein [Oceanicoccus sp. KOV_DT_Chl]
MNHLISDTALFIAGQGYFLLFIILTISGRKNTSNLILALFILVQSTKIFDFFLCYQSYAMPSLVNALHNLSFIAGPILYFYVSSLSTGSFRWRLSMLWHVVPFIAAVTYTLTQYEYSTSITGGGALGQSFIQSTALGAAFMPLSVQPGF